MPKHQHVDLESLASQLAPRVATLVLARLAIALGAVEAPYSTRRGYEPPEYQCRPKRWRADAPTIPGAVRVGRWWSVPRSAYSAWLASQSTTVAQPASAANGNATPWSPRLALAEIGLRATR